MAFKEDVDTLLDVVSDNIKIDIDTLNSQSEDYASKLIGDVTALFQNQEWIDSHPQIAKRLGIETETLRGLIKMRSADEFVHDALLKAIGNNNLNASLYRSLAEIQKTSLNITTKMNETITIINNLMRGFQTEIPFNEDDETIKDNQIFRGSKDFIKQMNKDQ